MLLAIIAGNYGRYKDLFLYLNYVTCWRVFDKI